jgi:hypothetical protein
VTGYVLAMSRLGVAAWRRAAALGAALGFSVGLGVLGGGCTTDHEALARQPKPSSGGGGSAGALAGAAAGGVGNTGNVSSQGGRVNPDDEPLGDDVLTIVNGVVDAPSVALCFARLTADGEGTELVGSPLPELPYGAHTILTGLEGISFADDTLVPWALAGDLALVDGLDCAAAVELAAEEEAKVTPSRESGGEGGAGGDGAGAQGGSSGTETAAGGAAGAGGAAAEPEPLEPPVLRARALPAIAAGSMATGRSVLMVLAGCLGGAAYTDVLEQAACGDDYSPSSPSVQPLVVKMSRKVGFDKVGLQGVQASPALAAPIDLRVAADGVPLLLFASGVSLGGIEPRPADLRFGVAELGPSQSAYGLQAARDGGVLFEQPWPRILAASGIEELEPFRNYTAVLLGPDPLLVEPGFWNESAFALVDSDPTRP